MVARVDHLLDRAPPSRSLLVAMDGAAAAAKVAEQRRRRRARRSGTAKGAERLRRATRGVARSVWGFQRRPAAMASRKRQRSNDLPRGQACWENRREVEDTL